MQETITLTLPKDIRSALDDLAHREGISPDDLIFDAIKTNDTGSVSSGRKIQGAA